MPENATYHPVTDKTEELIIYVASRLKDKPNYGSTLLGKSLYFIDSMSYLKKGYPITNLDYIKQEYGPTPDPKQYLEIRERLEVLGQLEKVEIDYFGRKQIRFIAKREPIIEAFDKDELVIINDVLENVREASATEISEYTHSFIAWIFAEKKEKLPFYTFLLTEREPDSKDYEWAEQIIAAHEVK